MAGGISEASRHPPEAPGRVEGILYRVLACQERERFPDSAGRAGASGRQEPWTGASFSPTWAPAPRGMIRGDSANSQRAPAGQGHGLRRVAERSRHRKGILAAAERIEL